MFDFLKSPSGQLPLSSSQVGYNPHLLPVPVQPFAHTIPLEYNSAYLGSQPNMQLFELKARSLYPELGSVEGRLLPSRFVPYTSYTSINPGLYRDLEPQDSLQLHGKHQIPERTSTSKPAEIKLEQIFVREPFKFNGPKVKINNALTLY